MSAAPFEKLFRKIHWRAKLVRLTAASSDHVLARFAPEDARAFVSDYAWVLVWPVRRTNPAAIMEAYSNAQQCLDDAFTAEPDLPGTVTDGYVLLALTSKPDDECAATVRSVELSTSICRKHVIWWNEGAWHRVDTVTLLSLPKLPKIGTRAAFPALTDTQWMLVEDVRANVKDAVARTLGAAGFGTSP